jgi:hypothetical protein
MVAHEGEEKIENVSLHGGLSSEGGSEVIIFLMS